MEEDRPKKRTRPPKFDYEDEKFYKTIEELAASGFTDASIAYGLAETFGVGLSPAKFSVMKNEKTRSGKPTRRAERIGKALSRGRRTITQAAKSTYLQMALGQRKVNTVVKQAIKRKCPCIFENGMVPDKDCHRCGGTGWYYVTDQVIEEQTTMELAPNMQALATWLFNHDEEWRKNIIERKREEMAAAVAEAEASGTEVKVTITYNQKEDLALQEKFKKPSE